MKPPVRQAHLQRELLLELDLSPAESVTELAERLQKTRPAVSRALRSLATRELAERRGRTWHLTPEGRRVAVLEARAPRPIASFRWQRAIGLEAAAAAQTFSGLDGTLAAARIGIDPVSLSRTMATAARIADLAPGIAMAAGLTGQLGSVRSLATEAAMPRSFALGQLSAMALSQTALVANPGWQPSL